MLLEYFHGGWVTWVNFFRGPFQGRHRLTVDNEWYYKMLLRWVSAGRTCKLL